MPGTEEMPAEQVPGVQSSEDATKDMITSLNSINNEPEFTEAGAAQAAANVLEKPSVIASADVPLTDAQRAEFAAGAAQRAADLANETPLSGGYTGTRISKMPGATDSIGRITGPVIESPGGTDQMRVTGEITMPSSDNPRSPELDAALGVSAGSPKPGEIAKADPNSTDEFRPYPTVVPEVPTTQTPPPETLTQ